MLASGRGDELASDEMLHAMRELLLPQTTILTPNSMEARRLADAEDDEEPSLAVCAQRLIDAGAEFVLITGTHEPTPQVVNTLYGKNGVVRTDSWQRLPGSYHGSGCTLASAIAAMLANGLELPEAVREAQDYTWHALQKAYRPGMGQFLAGSPVLGARRRRAGRAAGRHRRRGEGPQAVARSRPTCIGTEAGASAVARTRMPRPPLVGTLRADARSRRYRLLVARCGAATRRRRDRDPVSQQDARRALRLEQARALRDVVRGSQRDLHRQR